MRLTAQLLMTDKHFTKQLWIYPTLAIVVAAPYVLSGSLVSDFVFDDIKLVRDNEAIRTFEGFHETFDITSKRWADDEVRANYRPLRFLSYAIDYQVSLRVSGEPEAGRPPPFVFHLTNLLLHLANTLLVFAVGRRLLGDGLAAVLLALLFGLHPIQTESVIYISGRRDVLSMFFFLAALWLYVGPARWGDLGASRLEHDLGWGALFGVPVLFLCGLLSKEMVVTLPAVLLLVDTIRRARLKPRRVLAHVVLWSLAIGITFLKASDADLKAPTLGGDLSATLLTAPRYVVRYIWLLLAPFSQSVDYSYDAIPISRGFLDPWTTAPAWVAFVALLVLGLFALLRRRPFIALGVLWFLGTLTPVLQIVPIPERFAERFLYLPGLGILLLAAHGFRVWDRRGPVEARVTAVVVCGILFALCLGRCRDWRTPYKLWRAAAAAQPHCARAHIGYGNQLRELGKGSLHEALREYSRAVEILERDPGALAGEKLLRGHLLQARNFRADVLVRLGAHESGYYEQAIDDYRWLLDQVDVDGTRVGESDRYLVLYYHLGLSNRALGRAGEATAAFRKLLELGSSPASIDPTSTEPIPSTSLSLVRAAHYHLGKVLLEAGSIDEGISQLESAYEITLEKGTTQDRYSLVGEFADALVLRRKFDRATDLLDAVIDEMGKDSERKHLLVRKARILRARGQLDAAATVLEETLRIDAAFDVAFFELAGIEEARNDLDRAEELYLAVDRLNPGNPDVVRALQSLRIKRKLAEKPPSESKRSEKLRLLDGLLDRGRSHLEAGEVFAADDLFRRVADAEPDDENGDRRAEALRLLGTVSEKLNKPAIAAAYYQAALDVDPQAEKVLLNFADLRLASLEDRDGAAALYGEYIQRLEDDGDRLGESHAYYNLALLVSEKQPQRAIELLETARRAGHTNPALDRHLGYLHAGLGQWGQALERLKVYLEKGKDPDERARARAFVYDEVIPKLSESEEERGSATPADRTDEDGG